jgi:hypothetical protein
MHKRDDRSACANRKRTGPAQDVRADLKPLPRKRPGVIIRPATTDAAPAARGSRRRDDFPFLNIV